MQHSGAQRYMLPWLFDEIADMFDLFDGKPWPYGLDANRHTLEAFMGYLVEQGFIEKAAPIEDMFAAIVSWSE